MMKRNRLWRAVLGVVLLADGLGTGYAGTLTDSILTNQIEFKRQAWFLNQRAYPLGGIPAGARLNALQQAAQIRQNSLVGGAPGGPGPGASPWVGIGPAPILNGQVAPPQPVSGRVVSIAVDPNSSVHWLIGAAQGGVWETRDSGATWAPLTDNQASLAMGALAFGGTNSSIIYAGTGEANFSGDSYAGAGLLKSLDGGASWTLLATSTFAQAAVSVIRVSPSDPNTLLAATAFGSAGRGGEFPPNTPATGILKSIDGGITWALKLKGTATDLQVDPAAFTNQYAGLGDVFGSGRNGVYRSTDAGETWALIAGPWGAGSALGRIEMAVSPSAPATLYVSIQDPATLGSLGVWRTDNAWDPTPSWTSLPAIPTTGDQFWYDHVLSVDPTNAATLYLGETPLWKYDGTKWTAIGGNYDSNTQGIKIHPDQHALAWAGGTLIVGNDGGVWSTADGGRSFQNHNTTLAITQFYDGSIHPTSPNLAFGGSQDNGTELYTGGNGWQLIEYGDGTDNAISTGRPNTDWAVSSQGLSMFRTTDSGADFIFADADILNVDFNAPFVSRFEKAPAIDDLFIAGTDKVWKTTNFFSGATPSWAQNSPSFGASVTALAFAPSDASGNTYAAGCGDGGLHLTKDGGASWTDINSSQAVPGRSVTGLAFDPTSADVLYVTLSGFDEGTPGQPGHVFRTFNARSATPTWADVSTPVNIPHNTIVLDPADPSTLYVGTDIGVWKSLNAGGSWTQSGVSAGLPNVAVFELKINRVYNRLVAFTHGRGAFYLPLQSGVGGGAGADLQLTISSAAQSVVIGNNLTYAINILNNGPSGATNVVVTDLLPAGVTFVSATSSQGNSSQSGGTVTCSLGVLASGSSATLTVIVTPLSVGNLVTTATVASDQADPDLSNNSASALTHVLPPNSDLSVGLSASPNPAAYLGGLVFTATVVNHGPSIATAVYLTNTLPASVVLNSVGVSQGTYFSSGNDVVCNLGVVPVGASATAVMSVTPVNLGVITASATVANPNQVDPIPANNTTSLTLPVNPSADLGLAMSGLPGSLVVGSNITYSMVVNNFGPNTATNVSVVDNLPFGVKILSTAASQGTVATNGVFVTFNLGTLNSGATATATILARATNAVSGTNIVVLNNTASVSASQGDPNPGNNTAMVSTPVANPFTNIVTAGASLVNESFLPANGAIDVGETVTLALRLQNIGNTANGNLVATLLATNGVTSPSGPVTYGVLAGGGLPVAGNFTFTASGTNGGVLTAVLHLQDGATDLGNVQYSFPLPNLSRFAQGENITIPDHGAGSPYPSTNVVSGLSGIVGKVTVTLTNFNHSYPDDVDMLLVSPTGEKVLLMSHTGGGNLVTNVSLVFDDQAAGPLPSDGQIFSGTYQPTQNGTVSFAPGAPAGPYDPILATLNGSNPNGNWLLYVFDSSPGDAGIIIGGWSLAITTIAPLNQVADLALSAMTSPNPVLVASNLTTIFAITNNGPSSATGVAFTNTLPANAQFVSASASQGTAQADGNGSVYCVLTNSLAAGAGLTVSVVVSPAQAGNITNAATVRGDEIDLNLTNNSVRVVSSAAAALADLGVLVSSTTNVYVVGSNLTYTVTLTNQGPNTALGVVVTDPLPAGLTNVTVNSTGGSTTNQGGTVTCSVPLLAPGNSVTITIACQTAFTGLLTNTATLGASSSVVNDPAAANNSSTLVVGVLPLAPNIVASGAALVAESLLPPDGTVEIGETVTVSLKLANIGSADTTNLVATLQAAGGVSAPSGPQSYGTLVHGGAAAGAQFTFTATSGGPGAVVASLQLQDGASNLGTVTFTFNQPASSSYTNSAAIVIPDHGPGDPFPSTITVSGVTGLVSKATLTLVNFAHAFPDDVNVLLVGPAGQNLVALTGTGSGNSVSNVTLTFDDAATSALAASATLVSGTNKPSDNAPARVLPYPAPQRPYGALLSTFNGTDPNGVWSLFVFDSAVGDAGSIAGGWTLNLTTVNTVNSVADLGVSLAVAAPGPLYSGTSFPFLLTVTNTGPANATGVVVTNMLPAGLDFVSALASQGGAGAVGGVVVCNLGAINAHAGATVRITVQASATGTFTNLATVTGDQTDLDLNNNTARVTATVQGVQSFTVSEPTIETNGGFRLTLSGQAGQTYVIQGSTNLVNWVPLATNTPSTGMFKFIDTNSPSFTQRFYRAVFVPSP